MAKSKLSSIPIFPLFFSTSFYPRPCGNSLSNTVSLLAGHDGVSNDQTCLSV